MATFPYQSKSYLSLDLSNWNNLANQAVSTDKKEFTLSSENRKVEGKKFYKIHEEASTW